MVIMAPVVVIVDVSLVFMFWLRLCATLEMTHMVHQDPTSNELSEKKIESLSQLKSFFTLQQQQQLIQFHLSLFSQSSI